MAYNTKELEQQALEAIKEHGLIFIEEVVSFLPCSKPTFYEHGLNESNAIKEAITLNKVSKKAKLRKNWEHSENATLNISLYKLLANEEELMRLSVQKIHQETKQETKHSIDFNKLTDEQLDEYLRVTKGILESGKGESEEEL
jgi:hypothetical protein